MSEQQSASLTGTIFSATVGLAIAQPLLAGGAEKKGRPKPPLSCKVAPTTQRQFDTRR